MIKIPEFLLIHEVTVYPSRGETSLGESFGTPYKQKVRLERSRARVTNSLGEQVVAKAIMYSNDDVGFESKITLGNDEYIVVDTEVVQGYRGGPAHYKAVLA